MKKIGARWRGDVVSRTLVPPMRPGAGPGDVSRSFIRSFRWFGVYFGPYFRRAFRRRLVRCGPQGRPTRSRSRNVGSDVTLVNIAGPHHGRWNAPLCVIPGPARPRSLTAALPCGSHGGRSDSDQPDRVDLARGAGLAGQPLRWPGWPACQHVRHPRRGLPGSPTLHEPRSSPARPRDRTPRSGGAGGRRGHAFAGPQSRARARAVGLTSGRRTAGRRTSPSHPRDSLRPRAPAEREATAV